MAAEQKAAEDVLLRQDIRRELRWEQRQASAAGAFVPTIHPQGTRTLVDALRDLFAGYGWHGTGSGVEQALSGKFEVDITSSDGSLRGLTSDADLKALLLETFRGIARGAADIQRQRVPQQEAR